MSRISLSISVDDAALAFFDQVVKKVVKAGMRVIGQYPELGVLTGNIEESRIGHLRAIKGVASIERQRNFQLPPPESAIPLQAEKAIEPCANDAPIRLNRWRIIIP